MSMFPFWKQAIEWYSAPQFSGNIPLKGGRVQERKFYMIDIMVCLKTAYKRFLRDPNIHNHTDKKTAL
jgi:hypothetical protein